MDPVEQPTEMLGPGQVLFRVHGPNTLTDEMVSADVFAQKLGALVSALKAADIAVNGKVEHDYKIAKLKSSSPTVILAEVPIPRFTGPLGPSAITGFAMCAHAIVDGDRDRALRFGNCVKYVSKIASGAQKKFGYAEIWTGTKDSIRVDPLLIEQARAIIEPPREVRLESQQNWFKGTAFGSFDGKVLEADLRGALPEIKLVLSSGGRQLDCVCRIEDIEQIRQALNHRVRVYGKAIYDGRAGLPRRIQVSQIDRVGGDGDLTKWQGSFAPFEPSEWESDEA